MHYRIHIGLPKTGTKSIQTLIEQNIQKLKHDLICYPTADFVNDPNHGHHRLSTHIEKFKNTNYADLKFNLFISNILLFF